MLKKRILSALAASALVLGCTALPASAEDGMMGLISQPVSEVETGRFVNFGEDVYSYYVNDGNGHGRISGFFRLGADELKQWRDSGEFTAADIDCDIDLTERNIGWYNDSSLADGDYMLLPDVADDGNLSKIIIKYDKNSNSISETDIDYNTNAFAYTPDGYVVRITDDVSEENPNGSVMDIKLDDPNNKNKYMVHVMNFKGTYQTERFLGLNDYVCGLLYTTDIRKSDDGTTLFKANYAVLDRNNKLVNIESADNLVSQNWLGTGSNFIAYKYTLNGYERHTTVYNTENNKKYDIGYFAPDDLDGNLIYAKGSDGFGHAYLTSIDAVYGDRALVYIQTDYDNDDGVYVLLDLSRSNNEENIAASNTYKSMSTNDGEIYLVKNSDGEWGYIDSDGTELAMFDDAGSFIGEYAPVIEDGKAYLIDRDMNRVTEMIDADSVQTWGSELFYYEKDGEGYLMTFTKEQTAAPAPEKPEDKTDDKPVTTPEDKTDEQPVVTPEDKTDDQPVVTPEDKTDDKPVSTPEDKTESKPAENTSASKSEKGNPDTGAAASVVPLLILGAVTVMLTRRKK